MRWFWQRKTGETDNSHDAPSALSPPLRHARQDLSGVPGPEARQDLVRVYDTDTRQIALLPAAELAPGMVHARIQGIDGTVWVDASRFEQSGYQHPPFDEEIRDYLRQIQAALSEVYPLSLAAWEDGFRRDRTPDREIAFWLHLSEVYTRLIAPDAELGDTPARRHAVFSVLLGCGNSPRDQVLAVSAYDALTPDEGRRVIAAFYSDPETP